MRFKKFDKIPFKLKYTLLIFFHVLKQLSRNYERPVMAAE